MSYATISVKQAVRQVHRVIFFLVDNLGVNLRHFYGCMTEQLGNGVQIRPQSKHHCGECMAGGVKGKMLGNPGFDGPRLEIYIDMNR